MSQAAPEARTVQAAVANAGAAIERASADLALTEEPLRLIALLEAEPERE